MFQNSAKISKNLPQRTHIESSVISRNTLPRWYAAYTVPRHEKRVAHHFDARGIEHFLPLYRTVRKWKNGLNASVELPLFPNYIFVRIASCSCSHVLGIPGVLSIVGGWKPTPLPDFEIESLRSGLPRRSAEPHPLMATGEKVRIKAGPFAGMKGVLLCGLNEYKVVLTLEEVMRSVAVEVYADELERPKHCTPSSCQLSVCSVTG
jgi:transcription antitermination factor NusG